MKQPDYSGVTPQEGINFFVRKFIDRAGLPDIPFSPGKVIKGVNKRMGGLLVECGRIRFENDLNHFCQEYEPGEGWTGYDTIYAKFRYKGPHYVTITVWDRGTEVNPFFFVDNDGPTESAFKMSEDQKRIMRDISEFIHALPLPSPPVTYSIQ